jgi:hypothetical protein
MQCVGSNWKNKKKTNYDGYNSCIIDEEWIESWWLYPL